MSELTTCNFCRLNEIKERARRSGKKLRKVSDKRFSGKFAEGTTYHMVENKFTIIGDKTFAAWFWEMPSRCVC